MTKISRTYRLSEEVIQIIENRNKIEFPTANEYVEKAVMASVNGTFEEKKNPEILQEMQSLKKEMHDMKNLLEGMNREHGFENKSFQKQGTDAGYSMPEI